MNFDPEDQEIIRLLTKIKDAEGEYPEQMLVARRHSYLKRMGEISLGIPADTAIKNAVKDAPPSHISPLTSTIVETALMVAIIAEASTVAYFYRDRLTDFFRRAVIKPKVGEVTPPPVVTTSLEIQAITPSPAFPSTVPTMLTTPAPLGVVVTSSSTSIPGVSDDSSINTDAGGINLLNSTPDPNESNENNGNHYGQTPKPERTKENGNNPPPKDNEDIPPKENEDKPPKDNSDKLPKENNDKLPKK